MTKRKKGIYTRPLCGQYSRESSELVRLHIKFPGFTDNLSRKSFRDFSEFKSSLGNSSSNCAVCFAGAREQ